MKSKWSSLLEGAGFTTEKVEHYTTKVSRGSNPMSVKREVFGEQVEPPPVDYKQGSIDISFDVEGEKISLNTFLPDGWEIIERREASTHISGSPIYSRKELFIPRYVKLPSGESPLKSKNSFVREIEENGKKYELHNLLLLNGAMLMILHEFGHIHNKLGISDEEQSRQEHMRVITTAPYVLAGKDADFDLVTDQVIDELERKGLLREYIEGVLQEERDAWYYAFQVLRELRREGLDLEEGMTNRELLDFVRMNLSSYANEHPKVKEVRNKPN